MRLSEIPYSRLVAEHPCCGDFFDEIGIAAPVGDQTVSVYAASLDDFDLQDCGIGPMEICEGLEAYVERMEGIASGPHGISSIEIFGGRDKDGVPEGVSVKARRGESICIVGPTGSGKSRLLEDIEYLAQGDSPTGRRILVDGKPPTDSMRYSAEGRIVAQLSQSMTFVMDLSVKAFLRLHAESRMMPKRQVEPTVARALMCARELAGEPFDPSDSLTVLSGGQSRAVMISDLAFISSSPIVLIDEIENAGVDRMRALDLLTSSDKIVFVVTHDPLIALCGDRRLVIGNGGIRDVIEPSAMERANAEALGRIDAMLMGLRTMVRDGKRIEMDINLGCGRVEDRSWTDMMGRVAAAHPMPVQARVVGTNDTKQTEGGTNDESDQE